MISVWFNCAWLVHDSIPKLHTGNGFVDAKGYSYIGQTEWPQEVLQQNTYMYISCIILYWNFEKQQLATSQEDVYDTWFIHAFQKQFHLMWLADIIFFRKSNFSIKHASILNRLYAPYFNTLTFSRRTEVICSRALFLHKWQLTSTVPTLKCKIRLP